MKSSPAQTSTDTSFSLGAISFLARDSLSFIPVISMSTSALRSSFGPRLHESAGDPNSGDITTPSSSLIGLPRAFINAFDDARPALKSDLASRKAFNKVFNDSIHYALGQSSQLPYFEDARLSTTFSLARLKEVTRELTETARTASQSGLFSSQQLRDTARELQRECEELLASVEPGNEEMSEGPEDDEPRRPWGASNTSSPFTAHRGQRRPNSSRQDRPGSDDEIEFEDGRCGRSDESIYHRPRLQTRRHSISSGSSSDEMEQEDDTESDLHEEYAALPLSGDSADQTTSVLGGLADVFNAAGYFARSIQSPPSRRHRKWTSSAPVRHTVRTTYRTRRVLF